MSNPFLAEIRIRHGRACDANHSELARQQVVFYQIVESRNQLATGQIAARAKNYHGAGIGYLANPWLLYCGHCFSLRHI